MYNKKEVLLLTMVLVISACSVSPEVHETPSVQAATPTPELTTTPQPTNIPSITPTITLTLSDYSIGFTDCMTFELQVDERLVSGPPDFSTYSYIDSWESNDREIVLNTAFGYSLTLRQIEISEEHTIFSINDQTYQLNRGGILMLSFFVDGQERAQLFWAPHSNQFVSNIYVPILPPPALRLGISGGYVDDSPPSYFQSQNWCMEEAKSYYELFTSAMEWMEVNAKFVNADSKKDCYRVIFPNREVYAWGRNDSGRVLCPLLQTMD